MVCTRSSRISDIAYLMALSGLAAMLVAAIATVLWGANRSLGVGDEGIYVLSARYPEDFLQNVSAVYDYTGVMFWIAGYNVIAFRVEGFALLLLSGIVFWIGFSEQMSWFGNRRRFDLAFSFLFIGIGTTLFYQWSFMTPSNYWLTAFTANISCGAFLFGVARLAMRQRTSVAELVWFLIAGLALGVAIFEKFVSGICLFLLMAGVLGVVRGPGATMRTKLAALLAIVSGIAGWCAVHFTLMRPFDLALKMFAGGWTLYQTTGLYAPATKLSDYITNLTNLLVQAVVSFWPSYALLGASLLYIIWQKLRGASGSAAKWGIAAALSAAAIVSILAATKVEQRSADIFLFPFYLSFHAAWMVLLLAACVVAWPLLRNSIVDLVRPAMTNRLAILGLLAAAPIAAAVGTANPLYNNIAFYSVPWFAAIFMLAREFVTDSGGNVLVLWLTILPVSVFSASQIGFGSVLAPSSLAAPLTLQNYDTAVGYPETTLKLDLAMHNLVVGLREIAARNGFRPGDDVVAIDFIPGLVFAMGARSPGHPVFFSPLSAYTEMALRFADPKRLVKAFVLLNIDPAMAGKTLATAGLDFPKAYRLLGMLDDGSRQYTLWAPEARFAVAPAVDAAATRRPSAPSRR